MLSSPQEQVGEGGTVHITKTTISGDGSVRREMRFRTQSADSRVTQARSDEPMMLVMIVVVGDDDENSCSHGS